MLRGHSQRRQNETYRVFAEAGHDPRQQLTATAKTEGEAAHHDPLLTRVAPGTRGVPRPQAHAAVLNRVSGGRLARAGPALLQVQRQYGNRYVQQVVRQLHQSRPADPTGVPVLQPKLVLGPAHDRSEREADQVARQVAGQPVPRRRAELQGGGAPSPGLERARGAAGGALDAGTQQAVRQAAASGQPIPDLARAAMERTLGADFSRVKIHTGHRADQLNRSFQARALTTGQHVFFRHGAYDPGSPAGRALLAHELTHVVQQRQGATATGRARDGGGEAFLIQRDFEPEYQFPGRAQTKVGVGETVKLSVKPLIGKAHAGVLEWVDLSLRTIGVLGLTKPAGEADFVAGDSPGTAMLICRHKFTKQELQRHLVQIVAPDGGHMRQAPGTQIRHIPGWNVSFVGNQFLHPQDVSFHKIEFMEGAAPAQYHPSRADWKVPNQRGHPAGPWVDVHRARNSAEGSQCGGDDWVSSGLHSDPSPRPAGVPATMTWRIPWLWKPAGTAVAGTQFTTVDHVAYDYGSGRARLTKGGVDVSAEAAHPPQWFYPNLDENIDQIKGYYHFKHAAGYGAPPAVIDRRLRELGSGSINALADLLYAVREGNWEDPATLDPGAHGHGLFQHLTLNDLITEAAHLWGLPVPQ
jgi:hypothetical protein